MTYATQQDLVDRFGSEELVQLTDRTNLPPTTIDATVTGRALADADALIDSYLAERYTLPLASAPARLVKIASDVARFFLHGNAATEAVRTAFEDAARWLRDVSEGRATLDVAGVEPATGAAEARVEGPDRIFSRDSLRDF